MSERTITICGCECQIIYCNATEKAYEDISGKSSSVFSPEIGKDNKGNLIATAPPQAKPGDYITLGMGGIIAAYAKDEKDTPITFNDVMYRATAEETATLVKTIIEMRNEWYKIPVAADELLKKDAEQAGTAPEPPKNAPAPTNDSADS